MNLNREIIQAENDSPYTGSPQMGDVVYVFDVNDNRLSEMFDWIKSNSYKRHQVFNWSDGRTAIWFSDTYESNKFAEWAEDTY